MTNSIEIIGTESLGVRGLSCFVKTEKRRIFIDPGVALGYIRHGLPPHPRQVAEGERVQQRIIEALTEATDVVFSHFHGDHIPLREANPYQLPIHHLPVNFKDICCWSKSIDDLGEKMKQRAGNLRKLLGANFHVAEGLSDGPMTFSQAMPHGAKGSRQGTVMMTRIHLDNKVFLHASDIQLLDPATVDYIIACQPDIVLASGPPLYLESLTDEQRTVAWGNGLRLARNVDILILDHHLMRDLQGSKWIKAISDVACKQIYCAADFMGTKRLFLEAERTKFYKQMPVPTNWHAGYANGLISPKNFLR